MPATTELAATKYRLGAHGLTVDVALTNAEFETIGRKLGHVVSGAHWALGDWLVYGDAQGLAGAKFERAQEVTGLSYAVLSQALRVATAFPPGSRVAGVSWSHHRIAMPLPVGERAAVLGRAFREHWTAVMLGAFSEKRALAARRGIAAADVPSPAREAPHRKADLRWHTVRPRKTVQRVCPKCGHSWDAREQVK